MAYGCERLRTKANHRFTSGHRKPSVAVVGYCLLLTGCGSSPHLAPLSVGQKWDYRFRRGVERDVGRIEVVREVPLDKGMG